MQFVDIRPFFLIILFYDCFYNMIQFKGYICLLFSIHFSSGQVSGKYPFILKHIDRALQLHQNQEKWTNFNDITLVEIR